MPRRRNDRWQLMGSLRGIIRGVFLWLSLMILVGSNWGTRAAQGQSFMAEDGHVEFLSNVPLHSFVGTSDQMVGRVDLAENIVDFYVDLNTLDTGIGKRDKDMRKTLETKEYPFAEFYGSFVMLPDSAISDEQPVEVQGNFTLHGVTLPINVSGSVEFSDTGLRVKAGWKLYLDDYEIDPPRLLLLKVDEEQAITLDMLLKPE